MIPMEFLQVLENLLNLFNRVKHLTISIDDSLLYNARLNLEHQTFPNVESLHFSASGSTISLVKCFPKVRNLVCRPLFLGGKMMSQQNSAASSQDSRVILKHIHKALVSHAFCFIFASFSLKPPLVLHEIKAPHYGIMVFRMMGVLYFI